MLRSFFLLPPSVPDPLRFDLLVRVLEDLAHTRPGHTIVIAKARRARKKKLSQPGSTGVTTPNRTEPNQAEANGN